MSTVKSLSEMMFDKPKNEPEKLPTMTAVEAEFVRRTQSLSPEQMSRVLGYIDALEELGKPQDKGG